MTQRLARMGAMARAALLLGLGASAGPAFAQEAIGVAAVIRNDVSRGQASRLVPLSTGQNVVRRETVATGTDSAARLVFLDQTNLSLGPQARIVLDDLVVPGENTRGRAAINLAEGAFRFVSGRLAKDSYQIGTPTATIGIRGTRFDVLSGRNRTTVTLEDGVVIACSRGRTRRCVTLRQPGDTAVITLTSAVRVGPAEAVGFAALCTADPALCAETRFGAVPGGPVLAALCGR